ncbi:hypothetical protein C8R47DRAFT_468011 [Mycena vitilis]|nr:hypothetical protein C8R47DRAFT_468011 [Mycena vitilis]
MAILSSSTTDQIRTGELEEGLRGGYVSLHQNGPNVRRGNYYRCVSINRKRVVPLLPPRTLHLPRHYAHWVQSPQPVQRDHPLLHHQQEPSRRHHGRVRDQAVREPGVDALGGRRYPQKKNRTPVARRSGSTGAAPPCFTFDGFDKELTIYKDYRPEPGFIINNLSPRTIMCFISANSRPGNSNWFKIEPGKDAQERCELCCVHHQHRISGCSHSINLALSVA